MNFWSPFPFVRIFLSFLLGVLLANSTAIDSHFLVETTIAALVFSMVSFFLLKMGAPTRSSYLITGLLGMVILIMLGFTYTKLRTEQAGFQIDHQMIGYRGTVISYPEERSKSYRLLLHIDYAVREDVIIPANEKALLYLRKDSLDLPQYGDLLWVTGRPDQIRPPSNPGEFDFSAYWSRKGIYYQDFLSQERYRFSKRSGGNFILSWSYKIRGYFSGLLSEALGEERERSIAQALIIGLKDGLDSDIKEAYAAAGAMHVLAVSGLHVGILYLFILYAFRPLRNKKSGVLLTGVFSLIILWFYAVLTGFSPSVQRAVVMFSVFIIGKMFGRSRNIYNSLALSAFILVAIDPMVVFEVGFQLSYLAVFGIVFLQPRLFRLWSPDSWLVSKLWELSCVSLAAQLATFPLGIYYFHQFPTLFLLSNFVVIPASFLVLILGISLLITGVFGGPLYLWIGSLLSSILWVMNELVFLIDSIDFSLIGGLYFSTSQLFLLYGGLAFIIALFLERQIKYLVIAFFLFAGFSILKIDRVLMRYEKKEVVFYNSKKGLIDFRRGLKATLFSSEGKDPQSLKYLVSPDRLRSVLESEEVNYNSYNQWESPREDVQLKVWEGYTFLRVAGRQWRSYQCNEKLSVDFLIISNNSTSELSKLLYCFEPDRIIIDSTNSAKVSRALKTQLQEMAIQNHSTRLEGALVWTM